MAKFLKRTEVPFPVKGQLEFSLNDDRGELKHLKEDFIHQGSPIILLGLTPNCIQVHFEEDPNQDRTFLVNENLILISGELLTDEEVVRFEAMANWKPCRTSAKHKV